MLVGECLPVVRDIGVQAACRGSVEVLKLFAAVQLQLQVMFVACYFEFGRVGKYYLRRRDDGIDLPMLDEDGNPSGEKLMCHVTGMEFERPDMIASAKRGANGEPQYVSSLALATDKTGELVLPEDPPVRR